VVAGRDDSSYHTIVANTVQALKGEGLLSVTDQFTRMAPGDVDGLMSDIRDQLRHGDPVESTRIIDDLVFAYRYWIGYNARKLDLLDAAARHDATYADKIRKDIEVWHKDLAALHRARARLQRPGKTRFRLGGAASAADITLPHLIAHTWNMLATGRLNRGFPFESLREYEPFFRYLPGQVSEGEESSSALADYLCVPIPVAGLPQRSGLKSAMDAVDQYRRLRNRLRRVSDYGWQLEEIYRGTGMAEMEEALTALKRLRECVRKDGLVEAGLGVCDFMSLGLGVLGVASLPFNQLFGVLSLGLAIGSKAMSEAVMANSMQRVGTQLQRLPHSPSVRQANALFALLDGRKLSAPACNDGPRDHTRYYVPRHWRESPAAKMRGETSRS